MTEHCLIREHLIYKIIYYVLSTANENINKMIETNLHCLLFLIRTLFILNEKSIHPPLTTPM